MKVREKWRQNLLEYGSEARRMGPFASSHFNRLHDGRVFVCSGTRWPACAEIHESLALDGLPAVDNTGKRNR